MLKNGVSNTVTSGHKDKNQQILPAELFTELLKNLETEIKLQKQYRAILHLERDAIRDSLLDRLSKLTEQREQQITSLKENHQRRKEIVESSECSSGKKIEQIIYENLSPVDMKRILPLHKELKEILATIKKDSLELNGIVNFSMNLTNGILSILWSASNNVTRGYNSSGIMQERYNPSGGSHTGFFEKA